VPLLSDLLIEKLIAAVPEDLPHRLHLVIRHARIPSPLLVILILLLLLLLHSFVVLLALLSLSFLITFTVLIGIGIIGRLLRMHRRK
jgi:hypothetical protein